MARTVGQMVAEAQADVPAMSPQEVHRCVHDATAVIVDVRDSAEAQAMGIIPGAIQVGYGNLLFAADTEVSEKFRHPRLQDRSRLVITYCSVGPMSALAAKNLKDMGFTSVSYLAGGIEAWKAAGFDIEQESRS